MFNGSCISDGSCKCFENESDTQVGYWKGDRCDLCLDYYFDNTCSTYCNNADDSCVNGLCNQNGICD